MKGSKTETTNGRNRTAWHKIAAWQRLAEIVGEHVAKGAKVYVEGRLQTTRWEDRPSAERGEEISH